MKVAQKHRVLWTYFWLITAKSTLIAYITLKISYIEGNKWIKYLCISTKKSFLIFINVTFLLLVQEWSIAPRYSIFFPYSKGKRAKHFLSIYLKGMLGIVGQRWESLGESQFFVKTIKWNISVLLREGSSWRDNNWDPHADIN